MGSCSITILVPYILAPGASLHITNVAIYDKHYFGKYNIFATDLKNPCCFLWSKLVCTLKFLSRVFKDYFFLIYDLFDHVMLLAQALASSDADGVINGIIIFLRSRWSKWGATWLFGFGHVMPLDSASHNILSMELALVQSHKLPLNNHLNITNTMMSSLVPCDRKHVMVM